MANLHTASRQWATRPVDQRFWGLDDMLAHVQQRTNESAQRSVAVSTIVATASGDDMVIVGPAGAPAALTHYSFGQLSRFVGAPADYLRSIPSPLAASCINHGLQFRRSENAQLLLRRNGHTELRSITTEVYKRIWDADLIRSIQPALANGWRVPPARPNSDDPRARPATADDVMPTQSQFGLSVNIGDMIAPAGCYASDHDSFIFLVNPERIINDGGAGLMRGVFISNSEVGAGALKIHAFMVENVCGNHICWNANSTAKLKIVHKGFAAQNFAAQLRRILCIVDGATDADVQRMIVAARHTEIGTTKAEVIETLHSNRRVGLTKRELEAGWDAAVIHETAAKATPSTIWGMHHGLTRYSQTLGFADERMRIDSAAGRILALAV